MDKVDNRQEQGDNRSREREMLRKGQKECWRSKALLQK